MLKTFKSRDWNDKKETIKKWTEQQQLIDEMKKEITILKKEMHNQKVELEEKKWNNKIFAKLFEKGIIDSDWNLIYIQIYN